MASKVKRRFEQFGKSLKKHGFRIFSDIFMLVGAILMIVSLFFIVSNPGRTHIIILVGLFFVLAATVIGLIFDAVILGSKINKRSPRYRSALVHTIIMAIIFAATLFGIIWTFSMVL